MTSYSLQCDIWNITYAVANKFWDINGSDYVYPIGTSDQETSSLLHDVRHRASFQNAGFVGAGRQLTCPKRIIIMFMTTQNQQTHSYLTM